MIVHLIVRLIRHYIKLSQYFPKPFTNFAENINVKVDLSNYATTTDVTHVNISSFALKTKTEVDKLHIDKLVSVPADVSKLSDVVKNAILKKAVYDKLVKKVNKINTSGFALKGKYDTDKSELEKVSLMQMILLKKQNSLN